jgi:cell wall-associated NlpC family hydrolase
MTVSALIFSLSLAPLLGCAPVLRYPGPLASVGTPPPLEASPADEAAPADEPPAETAEGPWQDPEASATRRSARRPAGPRAGRSPTGGEQVALAAEYYLGKARLTYDGQAYRYDCSGLVEAIHARAGIPLTGNSEAMYELAEAEGRLSRREEPALGDVAFYENSYDRNGDGRINDGVTHLAVVTAIDEDGTVTLVHKGSAGVTHLYMNLRHPDQERDDAGKVLNSVLRRPDRRDPPGTARLTGELWVGYARYWETGVAENSEAGSPPERAGDDPA